MINFAHGEIYMAGAFTAVFVANYFADSGLLDANPVLSIFIWIVIAATISTVLVLDASDPVEFVIVKV